MSATNSEPAVMAHYTRDDIEGAILAGLRAAGKDPDRLTPADLAAVDQFHTGGREATLDLARRAGITADARVLDIGGGIGGPARTLAAEFGCHVTVLDLSEPFCRAGAALTERVGLADRVEFRHGSALALPFADAAFDVVWTQHSSMNIEDKPRLYAESHRVLRPGGRLALHEVMAGPLQPIHFPVMWAGEPSISFLRPADAIRRLIAETGFAEVAWEDETAQSVAFFQSRAAAITANGPRPLGLHLLIGPAFGQAAGNTLRNLAEGRAVVVKAVFDRRD